jgi:CxxC motif-containing protein (DUF1111 family)
VLSRGDPRFALGLALFDRDFHRSEGVGTPDMNADSCRGCHLDPVIGGAGALELNVSRFGDDGHGTYPFQNLPGGQGLSKLRPPWVGGRENYDPATATVFEQRQTPALFGGGLIDSVPDVEILSHEDPYDANGDGILGVARLVDVNGTLEVGRFGWKAQIPRLLDFVADAMANELGITTPDDGRGFALLSDADPVPDPELSAEQVDLLHRFLSELPAPERKLSDDPQVASQVALGEALFQTVGCAVCHIPVLHGSHGPVPLFSDLLLHDVMPAAFRGMAEPGADVGLYRTPPLWGVVDTPPYLHDGRAADLREAIAAHESEAAGVVQAFLGLALPEQEALIAFLRSL